MGKASYSPLGQWRNKVGGQVYRIDGGEQIITAYQPVVKNPRTEIQQAQRSRFTSASKFMSDLGTFLRDVNPTGNQRRNRAAIMKKILATMGEGATTISITANNGNLVLNPTDLMSLTMQAPTSSSTTFSFTGTIILADAITSADIYDDVINVIVSEHQLDTEGTTLSKTNTIIPVTPSEALEYTYGGTFVEGATGVIVEVSAIARLTAEAWSRFSRYNAQPDGKANEVGVLNIYGDESRRIIAANVGRGALRTT